MTSPLSAIAFWAMTLGMISALASNAMATELTPLRDEVRDALEPPRGAVFNTAGEITRGVDVQIRVCAGFGDEIPSDDRSKRGEYTMLDCETRSGEFTVGDAFGEWSFIYFKVTSPSGWEGYIGERDLEGWKTAVQAVIGGNEESDRARELQKSIKDSLAVHDVIASWGAEDAKARAKARAKLPGVRIGMTQAEVLASSWGKPDDINRTITAYGTREQWVYGYRSYLYFDDGILTAIQN
jgi:hypothetical protein